MTKFAVCPECGQEGLYEMPDPEGYTHCGYCEETWTGADRPRAPLLSA